MVAKPPYLGVAYYPEDWPEEYMDADIAKMKELGINLARIAEFAWHRMEPKEGEYDFSFFHKVVDKLGAAGIAVVLGTPSATPPVWFLKKYPDAAMEDPNGRRKSHGGRRHCCSNHPVYLEKSVEVARRMVQEFGHDPAVVGWQIDNEIYAWDGCFCDNCKKAFQAELKEKYGTIDALNEAWNLNLFSQWYDDFEDVPLPRDAWHNPHLHMAFKNFHNDAHIRFVHAQAEAMRPYTDLPIGTDTMPFMGMDYRKLAEKLDVMQFNHYNNPENLYHAALWMDYLRTLKDRPFWNTETSTCWSGSVSTPMSVRPDGFCRANSWMPLVLGGEANCYWLWRTHWAGHELLHGSVLDTSGRPMHIAGEVTETAGGFEKAREQVPSKVLSEVALHYDSLNWNMRLCQSVVPDMDYGETLTTQFYKPMLDLALRPDVIDSGADVAKYKVIVSPMMMTLEKNGLPEKMKKWLEEGGVWIAGPVTDVRNADGARYKDKPYGMLEEISGAAWKYNAPDNRGQIRAVWQDKEVFEGGKWFEFWEGGEQIVRATSGHMELINKNLVTRCRVGKGVLYLLGTVPSQADMVKLLKMALADAGVRCGGLSGEALVTKREDGSIMLLEYAGKPANYQLDKPMKDLISGETVAGSVALNPYQIRVLV